MDSARRLPPAEAAAAGAPKQPSRAGLRLVLASTSVYRRRLLSRLGLPFEVVAPNFDESAAMARFQARSADPADLARALARGKAFAAARQSPEAVVIGADQLAALEHGVLGKPGDAAGARAQLASLAGRSHQLMTAVAIVAPGERVTSHLDTTLLTMRELSAAAIAAYVEADQPFDCAGSYKIEEHGIALFERIETEDSTAIEGLPLLAVARILRDLGFSFP